MELTPTIQAQIKADALKSVRAVTNARTTNIFLHQEVLTAGHAVTNAVLRVPITATPHSSSSTWRPPATGRTPASTIFTTPTRPSCIARSRRRCRRRRL